MALMLGIESSCDETAAAVIENGRLVRSNAVSSQMAKHAVYGGVVPELAAREHLTAIEKVCSEALDSAGVTMRDIDAVAVTHAPGLVPALLVGLNFAKGLAIAHRKPLIGINHFLAHIYGAFVDTEEELFENPDLYPMTALVVSGGHTSIVIIDSDGKARVVGATIDDAAGEERLRVGVHRSLQLNALVIGRRFVDLRTFDVCINERGSQRLGRSPWLAPCGRRGTWRVAPGQGRSRRGRR